MGADVDVSDVFLSTSTTVQLSLALPLPRLPELTANAVLFSFFINTRCQSQLWVFAHSAEGRLVSLDVAVGSPQPVVLGSTATVGGSEWRKLALLGDTDFGVVHVMVGSFRSAELFRISQASLRNAAS